ncbi:MAG: 3-hydroxyacyl-CoA dehydrogenase family protein [Bacteriovoracaceae bacterium]
MTNVSFGEFLLNFGFASKEEKKNILKNNQDKKVVMDLTCYDPEEFYSEFPNLIGSIAALFADENKKTEIHFRERSELVLAKFKELGFTTVETTIISCGFIFPRTIVQIINEAAFALEEEVASKTDIDRAMKFGVNYPKGPFEWLEGREEYVRVLLSELLAKTGDQRYRISKLLK